MTSDRRPPAPPPPAPASRAALLAACAAILALVACVYARIVDNGFVDIDTAGYLTHNPRVLDGVTLSGFGWALTSFHAANWHPLTWWSHMLDVELFGLRPAAHHLVNVGFHAANSLLAFALVFAWTRRAGAAFLIGAAFAVHPLHVESVAWIVERKDVLSTFFAFLALAAWTHHVHAVAGTGPRARWARPVAIVGHALSLAAKPMWVTLPGVLLVLDLWPFARLRRGTIGALLREKAPFLVLSAVASLLTWRAQSDAGAMQGLLDLGAVERVGNALAGYAWYVVRSAWPSGLSFHYPLQGMERDGWRVLGVLFLLVGVVLAWWQRRDRPWIAAGLAWFAGMLVPVSGLVQVGGQAHADRYAYAPILGLFVAVAVSIDAALRAPAARRVAFAAALVVVGAWGVQARERVHDWKDSESLARAALAVDEASPVAHHLLGWALVEDGRVEEGLRHLERAVELSPGDPEAQRNLGRALVRTGQLLDGENHLRAAVAIRPNDPRFLADLAAACSLQGRFDEAGPLFDAALALAPDDVDARTGRGEMLERMGDRAGAEREYRAALEREAGSVRALVDLARLLLDGGRVDEAAPLLARVLAADPAHPQALQQDARVRVARGDHVGAVASLRAAIAARPQWPLALADLAWILACAPDPAARNAEDALRLATEAVKLGNQGNAAYLDVLAAALAANARFEDAATLATRALDVARARGEDALAARIEKRRVAYSAGIMDIGTPR